MAKFTKQDTPDSNPVTKKKARAFINWKIKLTDGSYMRSSKGFPLWENSEEYPNPQEDLLVAKAVKEGGSFTATLEVQVVLSNPTSTSINPDDICIG